MYDPNPQYPTYPQYTPPQYASPQYAPYAPVPPPAPAPKSYTMRIVLLSLLAALLLVGGAGGAVAVWQHHKSAALTGFNNPRTLERDIDARMEQALADDESDIEIAGVKCVAQSAEGQFVCTITSVDDISVKKTVHVTADGSEYTID